MKPTGRWDDAAVVGSWDDGSGGGPMIWHYGGRYRLTLSTGFGNYLDAGTGALPGTWQHVAATYDGRTARFYLNGQLLASKPFAGCVGDSDVWRIGSYRATPFGQLHGGVDDVRIHDRPLTAEQVSADMGTGAPAT